MSQAYKNLAGPLTTKDTYRTSKFRIHITVSEKWLRTHTHKINK